MQIILEILLNRGRNFIYNKGISPLQLPRWYTKVIDSFDALSFVDVLFNKPAWLNFLLTITNKDILIRSSKQKT